MSDCDAVTPPTSTRTPSPAAAGSASRSRSTVALAAADSPSSRGSADTSTALAVARDVTGAATSAMPGLALHRRAHAVGGTGGAVARTTTRTGEDAPGPVSAAAASKPWRASWSSGNWSSAPVPVESPSTGAASASRIAVVPTTASTGRLITPSVQRCQKPGPVRSRAPAAQQPRRLK